MEGCEVMWLKHYAVTEFMTMEKNSSHHIHCHMQAAYGKKSVDVSKIRRWVREFKQEEVG
jgi:hypothetical protein